MKLSKVFVGPSLLLAVAVCGLNKPANATPYYGPGIGSCQDAKSKQLSSARCFDANDHYARYENFSDWEQGKKSTSLWPGME